MHGEDDIALKMVFTGSCSRVAEEPFSHSYGYCCDFSTVLVTNLHDYIKNPYEIHTADLMFSLTYSSSIFSKELALIHVAVQRPRRESEN